MERGKMARFAISVSLPESGETPDLQAYVFTHQGMLLGSAPLEKGRAALELPAALDGRTVEVLIGPPTAKGQAAPTAAALRRAGAAASTERLLVERPRLEIDASRIIFPWCLCTVRGRLVKRTTLPDSTVAEQPVCHARVHICEVDRIPRVLEILPEPDLWRLRDDILRWLRPIPPLPPIPERIPLPPIPGPDPAPFAAAQLIAQPAALTLDQSLAALASTSLAAQARSRLADLSQLIAIRLCELQYLWSYFRTDCLSTVEAGEDGRFQATILHRCSDQPDIYLWVEQFQNGAWHTVYRPSIPCGTRWNYACGTEIVLNLPGAVACEEPGYDIPDGVTLFVLPYAVGSTPIWGTPPLAPPAPDGWLRPDGLVNYYSGASLGWLSDAPFGDTLSFVHDDSYFIPSSGVKYYRYSFRRASPSASPNTGAADPSWTPIAAPLARGFRLEYSDRLPTYESYPVGPQTVGANSSLFEFKPQTPPARPTDPATVVAREWTSGNLSEVAASWNTEVAAPPLSPSNASDDAGAFEVKIEVFDPAGNQVMPGPSTFRFLARNADGTTTRLSTPAEEAGGAYVFRVYVDNNRPAAHIPQPSIDGVAASDDCGFLRYHADDQVRVEFTASHPNDRAVFRFGIKRGSNGLSAASTTAPYVEVASASAPTGTAPYVKSAGVYRRDFAPADLVGSCVNAAFAASLGVYGKATNGHHRLGLDASDLIAFALAQHEDPDA